MAGLTSSHHGGLMCHPTSTAGYTGQPALCGQSPGFEPQHHRKEAEAYITPGLGMTAPKSEAVQCKGWARAGLAWPALTPALRSGEATEPDPVLKPTGSQQNTPGKHAITIIYF